MQTYKVNELMWFFNVGLSGKKRYNKQKLGSQNIGNDTEGKQCK